MRSVLSGLRLPLYIIPGNHDRRDVLLEAFSDYPYLPRPGAPFAQYVIEEFPVRMVALDTTCVAGHQGLLCEQRFAWVDATLRAAYRPTLIFSTIRPSAPASGGWMQ